ncbi:MAG TPA: CRISPR system precrRNA processing endoribonuclease RAMP protein Cas6 [Chloroflexota bacterium]|nr:CRISPR system precrRNA processing endoribonuclease RAMP protein Cas6 [Chloroflexota bacterium]
MAGWPRTPAGSDGRGAAALGLDVHVLRFRAEVTSELRLPVAAGAALRGALFAALRAGFCLAARGPECGQGEIAARCPVCFLLAPVEAGHRRGQDVPRPYALRVPFAGREVVYAPGQSFEFGMATFGRALEAFPYALLGIQTMGERGMGARRAGSFRLAEVWAEHPLAGRQERVYRAGEATVRAPALPVTAADVAAEARALARRGAGRRLRLTFATPTRLIEEGRLVKPPDFRLRPLVARLLERLDALGARYGEGALAASVAPLLYAAEQARVVEQRLGWREVFRASGRHGRLLPMSGLVGDVVVEGELGPLLPWLVWGSLVGVGKDATMGNGALVLAPA